MVNKIGILYQPLQKVRLGVRGKVWRLDFQMYRVWLKKSR